MLKLMDKSLKGNRILEHITYYLLTTNGNIATIPWKSLAGITISK